MVANDRLGAGGAIYGLRRKSTGLSCRDLGAGQKFGVTTLRNWPDVFWSTDEGMVLVYRHFGPGILRLWVKCGIA